MLWIAIIIAFLICFNIISVRSFLWFATKFALFFGSAYLISMVAGIEEPELFIWGTVIVLLIISSKLGF